MIMSIVLTPSLPQVTTKHTERTRRPPKKDLVGVLLAASERKLRETGESSKGLQSKGEGCRGECRSSDSPPPPCVWVAIW